MKNRFAFLTLTAFFAVAAQAGTTATKTSATTIAKCTMPKNADVGIEAPVKVTLSSDAANEFSVELGSAASSTKITGLQTQLISDAATVQASVGFFREALYVNDTSTIVSMQVYATAESADQEARMFKFLDQSGKLVTWAVLVDGAGSGCK